MADVWSYELADVFLFSPRVYFRLIELRNGTLWPGHLLTVGLGVAILYLAYGPSTRRFQIILSLCGVMWIWLAWNYFWTDYATINWAAAWFAPVAGLQGLLCLLAGYAQSRPAEPRTAASFVALGLLAFAVVGYPLIAPLAGRSWMAVDVFGIAPAPTAVATAAVLALMASYMRWLLLIVPLLWCVVSGVTLLAMDAPDYAVAPVCALIVAIAAMRLPGCRT